MHGVLVIGSSEVDVLEEVEDFHGAFEAAGGEGDGVVGKFGQKEDGVGGAGVAKLDECLFGDEFVAREVDGLGKYVESFGFEGRECGDVVGIADEVAFFVEGPAVLVVGCRQQEQGRALLGMVVEVDEQVFANPLFFSGQRFGGFVESTSG